MADAKIEIKIGPLSFSGEGPSEWLSKQLDKVLEKVPDLSRSRVDGLDTDDHEADEKNELGGATKKAKAKANLASFLRDKRATANQVRKFLATAVWIEDGESKDRITTKEVTQALSQAKQSALTNPSQCLSHNVSQGFCQKDGKKQFFVTPEGRLELDKAEQ